MEFFAVRADLSDPALLIVAGGAGEGGTVSAKVSSFVRGNNLLAGINALPFDRVSGREGEPRINAGLVISDGVMLSRPHHEFDALVFFDDKSAAIASQSEIGSMENILHAVGGFRRILRNGEAVPRVQSLNSRHPRSAAGLSADGVYLYLLVIDGRRPRSRGATELETALLLRSLGASDALNLDGGGSSALALRSPDGKVRVVNTPVHGRIPGRERAVAGCLGFGRKMRSEE